MMKCRILFLDVLMLSEYICNDDLRVCTEGFVVKRISR